MSFTRIEMCWKPFGSLGEELISMIGAFSSPGNRSSIEPSVWVVRRVSTKTDQLVEVCHRLLVVDVELDVVDSAVIGHDDPLYSRRASPGKPVVRRYWRADHDNPFVKPTIPAKKTKNLPAFASLIVMAGHLKLNWFT